ncbi:hypothetical protein K458DRAFT_390197 [Lentithecium fluviatile CBS 122367]|uniref:Uncharacterized protein n=1 Tax=Lentithecium fluviatile CBS 122367 TaxID=1168545 RepID=A0A6G1IXG0_9PLEO|nr:hypothetical protein K458DRAFT_390197 [Lentithecium fluviatile CBS 122367]
MLHTLSVSQFQEPRDGSTAISIGPRRTERSSGARVAIVMFFEPRGYKTMLIASSALAGKKRSENWRETIGKGRKAIKSKEKRNTPNTSPDDKPLTTALSPSPDSPTQAHHPRHELLHRHIASLTLDATSYPHLPTTPFPIRLLFRLLPFLFPAPLRTRLVTFLLSIQLLVLYSTFDYPVLTGAKTISPSTEELSMGAH